MDNTYLCHYGVKGQKWGVIRKLRNTDHTMRLQSLSAAAYRYDAKAKSSTGKRRSFYENIRDRKIKRAEKHSSRIQGPLSSVDIHRSMAMGSKFLKKYDGKKMSSSDVLEYGAKAQKWFNDAADARNRNSSVTYRNGRYYRHTRTGDYNADMASRGYSYYKKD